MCCECLENHQLQFDIKRLNKHWWTKPLLKITLGPPSRWVITRPLTFSISLLRKRNLTDLLAWLAATSMGRCSASLVLNFIPLRLWHAITSLRELAKEMTKSITHLVCDSLKSISVGSKPMVPLKMKPRKKEIYHKIFASFLFGHQLILIIINVQKWLKLLQFAFSCSLSDSTSIIAEKLDHLNLTRFFITIAQIWLIIWFNFNNWKCNARLILRLLSVGTSAHIQVLGSKSWVGLVCHENFR